MPFSFLGNCINIQEKTTLGKLLKLFVVVILILTLVSVFGPQIKDINFIKPIAVSVNSMVESFNTGDMQSTTSSRSYLFDIYRRF